MHRITNCCPGFSRHHSSQFLLSSPECASVLTVVSALNTIWYTHPFNETSLCPCPYRLGCCTWCCERGVKINYGELLFHSFEHPGMEYWRSRSQSLICHCTFPRVKVPFPPSITNSYYYTVYFYSCRASACEIVSDCGFNLGFPNVLQCQLAIFFREIIYSSPPSCFNLAVLLNYGSFLNTRDILLSNIWSANTLLHFIGCLFIFVVFWIYCYFFYPHHSFPSLFSFQFLPHPLLLHFYSEKGSAPVDFH